MKTRKNLRIALITNNYTPYQGGVARAVAAIADQLQKNGHDARIITLDFLGTTKDDPPHVWRSPCPIRFQRGKNWMAIPWRRTHHIKSYLTSFEPHIIHLHHPFLLGQTGLNVARALGVPTVFSYNTIYTAYAHYVPLPQTITRFFIRRIVPRFCNRVDRVIAPSSAIQQLLHDARVHTPSQVIPSPIREQFFHNQEEPVPHDHPLRLLYVGRFAKEKNLPFILEMLAALNGTPATCQFVGYGPDYDTFKHSVRNNPQMPNDTVQFVHKPPQEKLIQLYRNADLFLFPSTTDTQALVLAEAMASGTPVIAVPGPGQSDIIRHHFNGFFAETPADMAQQIRRLDADRPFLATLARNAIGTAQRYHPAVTIGKLLELYMQLLGS